MYACTSLFDGQWPNRNWLIDWNELFPIGISNININNNETCILIYNFTTNNKCTKYIKFTFLCTILDCNKSPSGSVQRSF